MLKLFRPIGAAAFQFRKPISLHRPYPFQHKLSTRKLNGSRLVEDFLFEIRKFGEYVEALQGLSAMGLDDKVFKAKRRSECRDGYPITPDEEELLDRICGMDNVMERVKILSKKWGSDENDTILDCLLFATRMDKMVPSWMQQSSRAAFQHQNKMLKYLPEVDPRKGFSNNRDVTQYYSKIRLHNVKMNREAKSDDFQTMLFHLTLKSPFGPLSSSSCYEELGTLRAIHLRQLYNQMGMLCPGLKLYLTIVDHAYVSVSRTVSVLVEDDNGQRVVMQVFNLKGVEPTIDDGVDAFPIGARFALRNPFLKLGFDQWIMLRVDQPFDLLRIDLPPLCGNILICGEGDFSFSLSLATKNKLRGNAFIVATSLESAHYVGKTYANGKENLHKLSLCENVAVQHGVDACNGGHGLPNSGFDSIVWNFPYHTEKASMTNDQGSNIIKSFLRNSKPLLSPTGRMYLSLAEAQGGTNREAAANSTRWNVEQQAKETGYEIVEVMPFRVEDYEGYEPKRAFSDQTFPYNNAKTHILQPKKVTTPGEAPSERSLASRLLSFVTDQMLGRAMKTHYHVPIDDAIQMLELDANRSPVARNLLHKAREVKILLEMIPDDLNLDSLTDEKVLVLIRETQHTFESIFATRNGELLLRLSLVQYLHLGLFLSMAIDFLIAWDEKPFADAFGDGVALNMAIKEAEAKAQRMEKSDRQQLGVSMCLLSYLMMIGETMDRALLVMNSARRISPNDPRIMHFCAQVKCNLLDKESRDFEVKRQDIIADLTMALDILADYPDEELYMSAIYDMAYAFRSTDINKAISLYKEYVQRADQTDRHLPAALYHIGMFTVLRGCMQDPHSTDYIKEARRYYQQGIEAEKERLSFFGPVAAQSKDMLQILTMMKDDELDQDENDRKQGETQKSESCVDTHIFCTAEEIRDLLMSAGRIPLSAFATEYRKKYNKAPFGHGISAKETIQVLSQSGLFFLAEKGKGTFCLELISAVKLKNGGKASTPLCTGKIVKDLILNEPEEMLTISKFVEKFTKSYGSHPFKRRHTKKSLLELAKTGDFQINGNTIISVDNCTSKRVEDILDAAEGTPLLEEDASAAAEVAVACSAEAVLKFIKEAKGKLSVSVFANLYQQKYGVKPFDNEKATDALAKLAKESGLFSLSPSLGGLAYILPAGTNDGKKSIKCTAETVLKFIKEANGKLSVSVFANLYRQKYGVRPFGNEKATEALAMLAMESGIFLLTKEPSGNSFLHLADTI